MGELEALWRWPTSRGSWPSLPSGPPEAVLPGGERGSSKLSGCTVTPRLHLILAKTEDHIQSLLLAYLPRPPTIHHCPWRTLWPGHANLLLLPGRPISLPCTLQYSAFLASSCTPSSRERGFPELLGPSLFLPLLFSLNHHQAISEGSGPREPEAPNLSPASPRPWLLSAFL